MFPGVLRKNDNLFIDAANGGELPFVRVYEQRETEVVHGPSCKILDNEIFVDKCESDGIKISERRGGGGTVVLSGGVLVLVVVGEKKSVSENAVDVFLRVHDVIIKVLREVGLRGAGHAGISDIAVDGKKILGASLYMGSAFGVDVDADSSRPLFYYQSSLMVDNDVGLIEKYLKHPPREPDYRGHRKHGDFCTSIKKLGVDVDIKILGDKLKSELLSKL